MAGPAIFTAASLACTLATTDTFLIIMRGLGAAVLLPAALSIVMNMFAEGHGAQQGAQRLEWQRQPSVAAAD